VKGVLIEMDIAEATALSPAVGEQLSVDECGRKFFFLNDSRIGIPDIRSLEYLLSGETISREISLTLLTQLFGNVDLEFEFLSCSKVNLLDCPIERWIDFEWIDI
jgi:hypothetical protein